MRHLYQHALLTHKRVREKTVAVHTLQANTAHILVSADGHYQAQHVTVHPPPAVTVPVTIKWNIRLVPQPVINVIHILHHAEQWICIVKLLLLEAKKHPRLFDNRGFY